MSDLQVQGNTKIVIVKDYGITHALKKLVEDNPNAVMTNGKISTEQWIHTMKALDAIQQKRLENNQSPIFSGGTDKSSDGWHTSYVVHPNQEIEFTPEEMTSLYNSMGVQINQPEEIVVATPEQVQAVQDSLQAKQDSIQAAQQQPAAAAEQPDDKQRYSLSWGQIGNIAANSGKNFVKNMFCDENGFSWKRTGTTLGTVLGLTFAAPIAAKCGGGKKLVNNIARLSKGAGFALGGYMTYHGGKNLIQGTSGYYNSTTEEEAKANMAQAWDGGIEAGTAIPAFFVIKGGANKGKRMAEKRTAAAEEPPKPAEVKPADGAESRAISDDVPIMEEARPADDFVLNDDVRIEDDFRPAEEVRPAEEFKLNDDVKPTDDFRPAEEVRPAEEARAADDVRPADDVSSEITPENTGKPADDLDISIPEEKIEVKPAETRFSEAKDISDIQNMKGLIKELLKKNPKNENLIKRFLTDVKDYNTPEFSKSSIETVLTQSADLLNCGLNVFIQNGKIYMYLNDGGVYATKLNCAAN